MNTNFMKMFLAVSTVSLFGTALHAQSYVLTADIPFAFQVANKTYEPGKYQVRQGSEAFPTLYDKVSGTRVFIAGASATLGTTRQPKLVFHCYNGDKCFLAEIWPTTGNASSVPKTRAEKDLLSGDRPREMATIAIDLRHAD